MIKLLYSDGSNCSQRVRWALNFKSVPYEVILYDSLSPDELIKISPLRKAPALIANDQSFAESVAILEYLEEAYPKPSLLPLEKINRAKVRETVEIINAWIHPIQCSSVPRFFLPELTDQDVKNYRRRWLEKTLPVLHDNLLFKESPFAIGHAFSWADLTLIPIYMKALILGAAKTNFPRFTEHVQHCLSVKSIYQSCPKDLLGSIEQNI